MKRTSIITQPQTSEEQTFDEVFRTYYSKLCLHAHHILDDLTISEDIVQDVFVNYWYKKDTLIINSSLPAYLYKSTNNACLNFIRKSKTRAKYEDYLKNKKNELNFEDKLVEDELTERINAEVDKLPDRTKKIFMMSRMEKLKYKEIAVKLDISIKTVESHISKALKTLTLELSEYLPTLLMLACIL